MNSVQTNAYKQPRRNLVYVGGIPWGTPEAAVVAFFSEYGPGDISIKTFRNQRRARPSAVHNGGKMKSFYILEVANKHTLASILSCPQHVFGDRRILCYEHKTGKDLKLDNEDKNKRRAIIRNVPIEVTDIQLKSLLEQHGGPLEVFFRLGTEPFNNVLTKHRRSYSVMFRKHEDATSMFEQKYLILPDGESVSVDPFIPLYQLPVGNSTSAVNADLVRPVKPLQSQPNPKIRNEKLKATSSSQELNQHQKHFKPAEFLINGKTPVALTSFNLDSESWTIFCSKPTTQAYHISRGFLVHREENLLHSVAQSHLTAEQGQPTSSVVRHNLAVAEPQDGRGRAPYNIRI